MNFKKVIALLLVLVLACTLLVGCGQEQQGQEVEKKTYTISFAHDKATTHNVHIRYTQWAEELNKATDGQVEIEFYPAQSLVTLAEAYQGVLDGVADIAVLTPAMTPGVFPMLELFDLPCYYNNETVLSQVYWDCIQKYNPAELSKVHVLNVYCMGPGALASNTEIKTLSDLKGKQIRAIGLSGSCMKALGASPVSVGMPDTYDALRKGAADGVLAGLGAMTTWNLIEVAQTITLTPMLSCSAFLVVMNNDVWNSLPKDIQEAFTATCSNWAQPFIQGETDEALNALKKFKELDLPVNAITGTEADKWIELMQPVVDEAVAARASNGDAQGWYNYMVQQAEKYNVGAQSYLEYYNSLK